MVWELETRKAVLTLSGHVSDVGFSPDGERIVAGASVGQVRLWDSITGQLVFTIPGHNSVRWTSTWAISPDSQRLAVSEEGETTRVYNAPRSAEAGSLASPTAAKTARAGDSEEPDFIPLYTHGDPLQQGWEDVRIWLDRRRRRGRADHERGPGLAVLR